MIGSNLEQYINDDGEIRWKFVAEYRCNSAHPDGYDSLYCDCDYGLWSGVENILPNETIDFLIDKSKELGNEEIQLNIKVLTVRPCGCPINYPNYHQEGCALE